MCADWQTHQVFEGNSLKNAYVFLLAPRFDCACEDVSMFFLSCSTFFFLLHVLLRMRTFFSLLHVYWACKHFFTLLHSCCMHTFFSLPLVFYAHISLLHVFSLYVQDFLHTWERLARCYPACTPVSSLFFERAHLPVLCSSLLSTFSPVNVQVFHTFFEFMRICFSLHVFTSHVIVFHLVPRFYHVFTAVSSQWSALFAVRCS